MSPLMLNQIALRRTRLLVQQPGTEQPILGNVLNLELGQLGFRLTNPAALSTLDRKDFEQAIATFKAMRGDNVSYVPLFLNFPNDAPNDHLYLARRVLGFFGLTESAGNPLLQRSAATAKRFAERSKEGMKARAMQRSGVAN